MEQKAVVVTGGSSGIGLAICKLFFERGYTVYSLSRTQNSENPGIQISCDVSSEKSIQEAFSEVSALSPNGIHLLINNAGLGISGAIESTAFSSAKKQFDVNFFGMFLCTKYALPLLKQTGGRIINISSAAAIFSIPFQGFYSASKSAINALTLALRNELKPYRVSVCAIMPGDVKTNFTDRRIKNIETNDSLREIVEKSVAVMEHDEKNGMSPSTIAAAAEKISRKKNIRPLYTIGFQYHLFAFLGKLLPTGAVNAIVGKMYIKQ